jgi:Ca-activated chloride channel family protein
MGRNAWWTLPAGNLNMTLNLRTAIYSLGVVALAASILAACGTPNMNPNQQSVTVYSKAPSAAPSAQPCCGEQYPAFEANPLRVAMDEPVSTFSIDVDTAAYANVRRMLRAGVLPPREAVRIEEMINYFDYVYPAPVEPDPPFRASAAVLPNPWSEGAELLHIGIQGYDTVPEERPNLNLVFLIDVSGSMAGSDRLDLVKQSLRLILPSLTADDRVGIATYASGAQVVLEPTPGDDQGTILAALDGLAAGGSTAGAAGVDIAYRLAERHFDPEAMNRVILATDGDFNVGTTGSGALRDIISRKRRTGIYLSVLTVGSGNLNDRIAQALAQAGNGNAAHIDTLLEARKVLVDSLTSTFFVIADDAKIQVEFNPARVAEYRLIGYETRRLRREDFSDDRVDAGDIGSGHRVTALYEITPTGSRHRRVGPLRYGSSAPSEPDQVHSDEYAYLKIRYKAPGEDQSRLIERSITLADRLELHNEGASEARFAIAVAAFGQLLRGADPLGDFSFDDVVAMAQSARGADRHGYRAEFVQLVRLAQSMAMAGRQLGLAPN